MEKHAYGQLKPEKLPKNISDIKSRQHVLRSMIEHFDNLCIYHQTWLDAFFQHKFSVYPMKNKIMQKKNVMREITQSRANRCFVFFKRNTSKASEKGSGITMYTNIVEVTPRKFSFVLPINGDIY